MRERLPAAESVWSARVFRQQRVLAARDRHGYRAVVHDQPERGVRHAGRSADVDGYRVTGERQADRHTKAAGLLGQRAVDLTAAVALDVSAAVDDSLRGVHV